MACMPVLSVFIPDYGVKSHKVRIVEISHDALSLLLKLDGSERLQFSGLPSDARVIGVSDIRQGIAMIKVESDEFSEIREGDVIPTIDLAVTRIPWVQRGREFL